VAAELTEKFPGIDIRLVEGSGGVFEVVADGQTIFSKRQLGRHANPGEVADCLRPLMK
jgi:selenoprotein W-related protein